MSKKKKDNDRLGNDPFNGVLPFIQDSRKKKEVDSDSDITKNGDNDKISSSDSTNTTDTDSNSDVATDVNNVGDSDSDINVDNDSDNVADINNDDINTIDSVNDADVADNINNVADSDNVSAADAGSAVSSTSDNYVVSDKITIQKKRNKAGAYSRMTFYLRPDQIRFINRLHKDSGRDKSELIRMAVDILIERARVE